MHEGPCANASGQAGGRARPRQEGRPPRLDVSHMLACLRADSEGAEELRGGSEVIHAGLAV